MRLRNVLLAASVLAFPAAMAMAQPINGLYVGGELGANWQQNQKITGVSVKGEKSIKNPGGKYENGFGPALIGSVGYGFGNGLRAEGELNYRYTNNKIKDVDGGHGSLDHHTYGMMANVLYDINGVPYVTPYVGAGVGLEMVSTRGFKLQANGDNSQGYSFSGDNPHFGAQAIAGVAVPTGVPGLDVTAEYRFLAVVGKDKLKGTYYDAGVNSAATITSGDQYNHSVLVGLRYAFGAAPAPAPMAPAPMVAPIAAPAPAPARTYLVFFDWDKADLTPRAHQIISEAAQNSTKVQVTQIEVDGHADRSGTPAYNMKLSQNRAQAVASELIRLGVPQNEIFVQAFGDTHPLVPTAAGVREPQNRRVEIVLK